MCAPSDKTKIKLIRGIVFLEYFFKTVPSFIEDTLLTLLYTDDLVDHGRDHAWVQTDP